MNGLCARLVVVRNTAVFLHTDTLRFTGIEGELIEAAMCDRKSSADTF